MVIEFAAGSPVRLRVDFRQVSSNVRPESLRGRSQLFPLILGDGPVSDQAVSDQAVREPLTAIAFVDQEWGRNVAWDLRAVCPTSKVFPGRRVNCCGFARARAVGPSDLAAPVPLPGRQYP